MLCYDQQEGYFMNSKKPQVLFLCTGNSARSQMAEALLKRYAGNEFEVHSAGTRPSAIHPFTTAVMSEMGIDLKDQRSKSVREFLGRLPLKACLITVCQAEENGCPRTWAGPQLRLSWPFEDPAACEGSEEERLAKFRAVRNQIDEKIKSWLKEQALLPKQGEA
jgi:arsenate reductase